MQETSRVRTRGHRLFLGIIFVMIAFFAPFSWASLAAPKNPDYTIPLWFEVLGDGVEMLPLQFSYNLKSSEGRELELGPLKITRSNLNVSLVPVGRLDPRLAQVLPPEAKKEFVFLFNYPSKFMTTGVFEMISRTGRVLWTQKIQKRDLDFWQTQVSQWKTLLIQNGGKKSDVENSPNFQIPWGLRDARNATPFWKTNETFRFCYTQRETTAYTRLCTPYYESVLRGDAAILQPIPLIEKRARVILQNADAPLRGTKEVETGKTLQFFAELAWGASYEFSATPQKPNIIELTEVPHTDEVHLVGEGILPLADYQILREEKVNPLAEVFGWQETIGDFRRYWMTKISRQDPFVMVAGVGGGAFVQRFKIDRLPREEARIFLHRQTVKGTYKDNVRVLGAKNPEVTVRTRQNSVEMPSDQSSEFTWYFGAKNKGSMNRSYLAVKDQENVFRAYHEIYKGYPLELSARLSEILGAGHSLLLVSEFAASYWFEDLFGWENDLLSRQRWGINATSFQSLSNLNFSGYSNKIQVYTVNLKYRFSPGLWGRDETWGMLGSYQQLSYDIFQTGMYGLGIFWGRSMPQIFDNVFNLLPFMRYPKWVDCEFIYYLQSTNSGDPLVNPSQGGSGNWSLNFHGQMMVTPRFFGEAGFGLKNYDFNQTTVTTGVSRVFNFNFTSFYVTMGVGYKF